MSMAANEHRRHPHRLHLFPLAQYPDSPSVYSHAYNSPDPDITSFAHDVDDETASTIRSFSTDGIHDDDSEIDDLTDDASHRISLQGPRIRFHSRAPWETDSEGVPDQPENNPKSSTTATSVKPRTSKTDTIIRTFTRGPSTGGRPSVDSSRSQVSRTSSFEVTTSSYPSPRGALYDLARQLSSSSLTSTVSASSQRPHNASRGTIHPKSPHNYAQPHDMMSRAVSLDAMIPPTANSKNNIPLRSASSDISRVVHKRSTRASRLPLARDRQTHGQFVHPYANPDLVLPYTPSPETISHNDTISEDMTTSDSVSTVADTASTISAAFSATSTETSSTSLPLRDGPCASLRVNGKEISSPISILHQGDSGYVDRDTRFMSLHPPPVGFDPPLRNSLGSRTPTVTLISLQEAQARERFRSNTVQQNQPGSDDIPEVSEDDTLELDSGGRMSHTRARSSSAGALRSTLSLPPTQPKNTELRDESSVSPLGSASGRAIKHKKSGFMRLFGGRVTEEEKEKSPPPPIPAIGDVCAEETCGAAKTSKLGLPRAQKSSPTGRSGASNVTLSSVYSDPSDDGPDDMGPSPRRRQPPLLSIVTKTSDPHAPPLSVGTSSPTGLNLTSSLLTVPQSAPPGDGGFPGLKLRPVSTSFSSHFADIVAGPAEESQRDVCTPSSTASSNTALTPLTPVSARRSDDASGTAAEAFGDDHVTIKALQDQLVASKLAWQQQIWELRGQVRDLTSELEDLRATDNGDYCEVCGRGELRSHHPMDLDEPQGRKVSVVDRPRARTGDTARFANGNN